MQQNSFTPSDSVLIHGITLNDVERLFNTINEIDSKISKVLENIPRPPQQAASGLYKRREAAKKVRGFPCHPGHMGKSRYYSFP